MLRHNNKSKRLGVVTPGRRCQFRVIRQGDLDGLTTGRLSQRQASIKAGAKPAIGDRVNPHAGQPQHRARHVIDTWHGISLDQQHPVAVRTDSDCRFGRSVNKVYDNLRGKPVTLLRVTQR